MGVNGQASRRRNISGTPPSANLAPGACRHPHVREWVDFHPRAKTFICPELERKIPALKHFRIVKEVGAYPWPGKLDHLSTQE